MQRVFRDFGLALLVVVSLASFLMGQDARGSKTSQDADQNPWTLTGCLYKGEKAGEFKLQAEDGGVWRVAGDKRELGLQVGHTVTLSGDISSAESQTDKEAVPADKEASVAPHLRNLITVTTLARVSDGCQSDLPLR